MALPSQKKVVELTATRRDLNAATGLTRSTAEPNPHGGDAQAGERSAPGSPRHRRCPSSLARDQINPSDAQHVRQLHEV